nr:MAG TPA: hypothetical protein [Bacteriophage sp.]
MSLTPFQSTFLFSVTSSVTSNSFLGYTLAYLRTVVKHYFISGLCFFLTFYFRRVTLCIEGGEKCEHNQ